MVRSIVSEYPSQITAFLGGTLGEAFENSECLGLLVQVAH